MKPNELPGFDEHPQAMYDLMASTGLSNAIPVSELVEAISKSKEFKDYSSHAKPGGHKAIP